MSFDGFQPATGNRNALSRDEQYLLDETIIPTAKRWVESIPTLAEHGKQTLAYWGEPIPEPRERPRR